MTVRSVLLVNSDLAVNRGDRAIAEGNIQLVRERFPQARVTILSQHAERDSAWYGADVLAMDFQSLSPVDLVRLLRAARAADIILWGGGELLKDYTNRAALWYWALKMTAVSWANPRLFGAFQGIGPTSSRLSRRIIAYLVNRCQGFAVRDAESRAKAVAWGADPKTVVAASDPAVLPEPGAPDPELRARLDDELGIDDAFLADFVCLGPRDWFHYRTGGFLPYKYARRLPWRRSAPETDPRHELYLERLAELVSELTSVHRTNVLFAPMHLSENDTELCYRLRERCSDPSRVRVLDKDVLSPAEFRAVLGQSRAMLGFRLHSTIVAVSAGVPSMTLYYVDKGRVFFDQIGQQRWARPIEDVLAPGFVADTVTLFGRLLAESDQVRGELAAATETLRAEVRDAFDAMMDRAGVSGGSQP
ncbi:polysaccharide pyruvyl transferase family protein [Actinotalea sp. M2MS4P-6]|uniref:polysaccharide pyruvyl transferase family protein n=1 Tax=Actinotalea sp. M2MS4P-6 TaxID=2983762 RepID=UPI0021E364AE|nr:polysaccharide pyruvyl transferase family protein [Actinotalea sp. M2MS4P-6]MCV2394173.1 polysaccharide pyruvyl transferase family protein [Actinotalea sp. M2MS4P-6]